MARIRLLGKKRADADDGVFCYERVAFHRKAHRVVQGKRLRRGSRDRVSDDLDIFVKFIHIFVVFGAGKISADASGAAERAIFYCNISKILQYK